MTNRPTSPHLLIYRWQITMVLSIIHRFTGVGLYGGAFVLVGWLSVAAYMPSYYELLHEHLSAWYGLVCLFGWTFAFYYHLANGIRHMCWDIGKGYTNKQMTLSGYTVVAFTAVTTIASWCYAYHVLGKI